MIQFSLNKTTKAAYTWLSALLLFSFFATHDLTAQVSLGQVDDFNDGTTQNWMQGQMGGLSNQSNSLQVVADGAGSLGKLVFFNETQWQGNYIGQGINSIKMKVNNISSNNPVFLRLVMRSMAGGSTTSFISKDAIEIPSGSGQVEVVFPIAEADFDKSPASGASY
ncbi:MAG: hypothetical protein AAF847_15675, partial [Bacteroidota bacterium]